MRATFSSSCSNSIPTATHSAETRNERRRRSCGNTAGARTPNGNISARLPSICEIAVEAASADNCAITVRSGMRFTECCQYNQSTRYISRMPGPKSTGRSAKSIAKTAYVANTACNSTPLQGARPTNRKTETIKMSAVPTIGNHVPPNNPNSLEPGNPVLDVVRCPHQRRPMRLLVGYCCRRPLGALVRRWPSSQHRRGLNHYYGSTTIRTRKSRASRRNSPGWTASNKTG